MRKWSFSAAADALRRLPLKEANRSLAKNWLSSWRGGRPPAMALFLANTYHDQRPAIAIFRVREGQSLRCISAGAYYKHVLGFNIADRDVLEMVKQDDAEGRLARAWDIVQGAALITDHIFQLLGGSSTRAQGLCLPLLDELPDGSCHYLLHVSWRPTKDEMMINAVRGDLRNEVSRTIAHFEKSPADSD